MLKNLSTPVTVQVAGGKATALSQLAAAEFPVPQGVILTTAVWQQMVDAAGIKEEMEQVLLSSSTADKKSEALLALIRQLRLPPETKQTLGQFLHTDTRYAVRSSGVLEDMKGASFAGQYHTQLNVQGLDDVSAAVLDCYASAYSPGVLEYLQGRNIHADRLTMSVLIQEMVPAETSGVLFTLNPITGVDSEMLIEVTSGLGQALVDGQVTPEQYRCHWTDGRIIDGPDSGILSEDQLKQLTKTALDIQLHFGYPCDIEFAFAQEELFILQARPITQVAYQGITDLWSTADFRDGGVSASVCMPLMWGLYEYAWENSLGSFLCDGNILPRHQLAGRKLGEIYYGRPYWNLSVVKEAMSRIPGYKEREFDREYGLSANYEGDGQTTALRLRDLPRLMKMMFSQITLLRRRRRQAPALHANLLQRYQRHEAGFAEQRTLEQWQQACLTLTKDHYLESESIYFSQIFINTVHQALFKGSIKHDIDDGGYLALIGGLNDISHLRPFYRMWEITREIRQHEQSLAFWQQGVDAVLLEFRSKGKNHCIPEFAQWLKEFGYHSRKELDITCPNYIEEPEVAVQMFLDTLALGEEHAPDLHCQRQQKAYQHQLDTLQSQVGSRRCRKLTAKIEQMRKLLWWREEFRDISTRYYHLIRLYVGKLGTVYEEAGKLTSREEIWFLRLKELWAHIEGDLSDHEMRNCIKINRQNYCRYRNYLSQDEIGNTFPAKRQEKLDGDLCGLGCSPGIVTGTARVVNDLNEVDRLQEGDILVTRFTDTGWTSKFALLSGIVTEYGGVLCHAAIVSREYGIPCAVCVENATARITDGAVITLDGTTGSITLHSSMTGGNSIA